MTAYIGVQKSLIRQFQNQHSADYRRLTYHISAGDDVSRICDIRNAYIFHGRKLDTISVLGVPGIRKLISLCQSPINIDLNRIILLDLRHR